MSAVDKIQITHPDLTDHLDRVVVVLVLPRQAKVLADSGWVPVNQPELEQPEAAPPAKKKTAAPKNKE